MSQKMQVAPRTGKGKETDSPLEPPEGKGLCLLFDFSSVRPIVDSDPQNCKTITLCFLNYQL